MRRIYGYPGDGINGVFGALQRAKGKIEFIQVRHEEMAAFMASAHAKFTGELGRLHRHLGPGRGASGDRALRRAARPHAGAGDRRAAGAHRRSAAITSRKSISPAMFKDVAGALVQTAMVPAQVRHLIDRAVRIALGERRVTALVFPNDLQELTTKSRRARTARCIRASATTAPKTVPYERELRRAADVLNAGKKVAILVGAGALQRDR